MTDSGAHGDSDVGRDVERRDEWIGPGPETVAPGVHRIPLPLPSDGLRAVNVYAIEDGDGLVLIDGGWALAASMEQLESSLKTIGRDLREVRNILVTHIHRDHYTQAIAIRRAVGAAVSLGINERSSLESVLLDRRGLLSSKPSQLHAHGATLLADELEAMPREASDTLSYFEEPDVWLEPGDVELETFALTAVHTPGHTRGHTVFHWPERGLLFAGDHVLPHITPSIGFEPDRPPFPLRDYLESLAKVLDLPEATLLPAHGPVGGSSHDRSRELLAHHERRLADTHAALHAGAGMAFDVARILRWTRRERRFDELGAFDRMLAVFETAAHLDVLVLRGVAVRDDAGDVVTYELSESRD